jgi:hypothetical protein
LKNVVCLLPIFYETITATKFLGPPIQRRSAPKAHLQFSFPFHKFFVVVLGGARLIAKFFVLDFGKRMVGVLILDCDDCTAKQAKFWVAPVSYNCLFLSNLNRLQCS